MGAADQAANDAADAPKGGALLPNLVRFAALLRPLGIKVSMAEVSELARALDRIGWVEREDVRAAAGALFVRRKADLGLFEMAFDQFFRAPEQRFRPTRLPQRFQAPRPLGAGLAESPTTVSQTHGKPANETARDGRAGRPAGLAQMVEGEGGTSETETLQIASYSPDAALIAKDFAAMSEAELAAVKRFLQRQQFPLAGRLTRRLKPAPHGPRLDPRRMLRHEALAALSPPVLRFRAKKQKPRPIVVLCDVSGSMERYVRVLLAFLHALTHKARRVEAFAFSTELSRITRALEQREIGAALAAATAGIHDYGGGTRIGAALKAFNFEWGRRVLAQGPIVLIISDGWDRGDTGLLAREMERLKLSCHALIWLNPLLGMAGFEPLTKGLQAALPFTDYFLPVHNLASLESLSGLLALLDAPRPLRRTARARATVSYATT